MAQFKSAARRRRDRNGFRLYPAPLEPMSRVRPEIPVDTGEPPDDLLPFVGWFMQQEDAAQRFAWVLRDSLDDLLDGQRTGRWCYQHTSKTERTHLGTMIEINLTKEFSIPNGDDLDWKIAGYDIDCKFSRDFGAWEIPMEMYLCSDHGEQSGKADHPALVTWVNDDTSQWAVGIVRVRDDLLAWKQDGSGRAYNRDNKRKIARGQRDRIHWMFGGLQQLPPNTLRHIDADVRGRIFADHRSGQKRVDALFRELQKVIIRRPVVLTVGQQDDAPKRVRDARNALAHEGIVVLGHQEAHPKIATDLGLPICDKGEWLSVRLVDVESGSDRRKTHHAERYWAVAGDDEWSPAIRGFYSKG